MDFDRYQKEAMRTDHVPAHGGSDGILSLIVPMLGLAGETGQLLSEYKKHLRDGEAHRLLKSACPRSWVTSFGTSPVSRASSTWH